MAESAVLVSSILITHFLDCLILAMNFIVNRLLSNRCISLDICFILVHHQVMKHDRSIETKPHVRLNSPMKHFFTSVHLFIHIEKREIYIKLVFLQCESLYRDMLTTICLAKSLFPLSALIFTYMMIIDQCSIKWSIVGPDTTLNFLFIFCVQIRQYI